MGIDHSWHNKGKESYGAGARIRYIYYEERSKPMQEKTNKFTCISHAGRHWTVPCKSFHFVESATGHFEKKRG
jgi:hypothetical protein